MCKKDVLWEARDLTGLQVTPTCTYKFAINKLNGDIFYADSRKIWRKVPLGLTIGDIANKLRDLMVLEANGIYTIAAGVIIQNIIIKASVESTIKVGTAADLDDIIDEQVYNANSAKAFTVAQYADGIAKNIYFTGITATTTIQLVKNLNYATTYIPGVTVPSEGGVITTDDGQVITTDDGIILTF